MRKIIFVLLSAIMLQSSAKAQFFQNSTLPESMIPKTNLGNQNHIHYATNYSYGNAEFMDYPSDLYVATWVDQNYGSGPYRTICYYKRTEAGNPTNVLQQDFITILDARIMDAKIIRNPDFVNGISSNEYCVIVAYIKGGEGWIDYYEWDMGGMILLNSVQFVSYPPGDRITYLRMDVNNLEYFVAVYEDNNHNLYAFAGTDQSLMLNPVTPLTNMLGLPETGLFPDVAMNKNNVTGGTTNIKLFFAYIDTDRERCWVKEAYFDDLLMGSLVVNTVDEIPDFFQVSNVIPPDISSFFPSFPLPPTSIDNVFNYPFPVFGGLRGPIIDAPDNSIGDTWAVVVEEILGGQVTLAGQPPFNTQLGTFVVSAYQYNNMFSYPVPNNMNKRILNIELFGPRTSPLVAPLGIPGGVNMAFKNDNAYDIYFEPIYAGLPAVAFTKAEVAHGHPDNDFYIVYAWGNTKDIPMLNDHEYISIVMDMFGNPVMSGGGDVYRLVDFDASVNPYHRVISLSGENVTTNDLYTIFTADVQTPFYSECIYEKHPDWSRFPMDAFRPAGIKDNQIAQQFFKIHPSPFQTQFILSLPSNDLQSEYQMTMSDIFGRVVFTAKGNTTTINKQIQQSSSLLQQLSPGVYLIHLDGNKQSQSIKIIKD